MRQNTAKRALRAGERVYGTSLEYCLDPEMPLLLKKAGLDFFFVDTEHQPADYHEIRALCRTASSFGITPLVRITQNEPALITRALDCGAMGIIVPRVHTPGEASRAISVMRYTPEGNRGFGMHSIMTDFDWKHPNEMMAEANRETLAVCQVESQEALDSVEQIAATPGLDVLFIGPYDLSISMGIAEQFESETFLNAVDRVIAACATRNVAAGIQTGDIALLKEAKRRGVRFLLYSGDYAVLYNAYRTTMASIREE